MVCSVWSINVLQSSITYVINYINVELHIDWSQSFPFLPAVVTFDEQAIRRQAAVTPAGHGPFLLWGAVAVRWVVLCSFMITGAEHHAVEIHAGDDGLGKRGSGWGRGWGCAIVVILTTHNGRLLHLQTTGVQAKRETENGDEWKWGQKNRYVKQYSC